MGSILNQYKLPITAKDFISLEAAFKQYIIDRYSGDISAITITELMQANIDIVALMGDAHGREAERAGGEQNLAGAIESQSILDLCYSMYGYIPVGTITAVHEGTLTSNSTDSFVIPIGTQFSTISSDGTSSVTFETVEEVIKPLGEVATTLTIRQGVTKLQTSTATGDANLLLRLDHTQIDTNTIAVTVNTIAWNPVRDFSSSLPTDLDYRIVVVETIPGIRTYNILFGSGFQGRVPTAGSDIQIAYVSPGGTVGNVPVNSITRNSSDIVDGLGNSVAVSFTNTSILSRGIDEESVDISRIKAPLLMSIHGGIVNLEDYTSAAILQGAARAISYSDAELPGLSPNTVLLLFIYDLVTLPTDSEQDSLKAAIEDSYKVNGTARLVVSSSTFLDKSINITVYVDKGISIADITPTIQARLDTLFSLNSTVGPIPEPIIDIGKDIPYSHVTDFLQPVTGIYKVSLPDITDGFNVIESAANSILRITTVLTVKTRGT